MRYLALARSRSSPTAAPNPAGPQHLSGQERTARGSRRLARPPRLPLPHPGNQFRRVATLNGTQDTSASERRRLACGTDAVACPGVLGGADAGKRDRLQCREAGVLTFLWWRVTAARRRRRQHAVERDIPRIG